MHSFLLEAQISSLWREWACQQAPFSNPVWGELLIGGAAGNRICHQGENRLPWRSMLSHSKLATHASPPYSSLWGFCSSAYVLLGFTVNSVRIYSLASPLCSGTRETTFIVTFWRIKVPKALSRQVALFPLYPDIVSIMQLLTVLPGGCLWGSHTILDLGHLESLGGSLLWWTKSTKQDHWRTENNSLLPLTTGWGC